MSRLGFQRLQRAQSIKGALRIYIHGRENEDTGLCRGEEAEQQHCSPGDTSAPKVTSDSVMTLQRCQDLGLDPGLLGSYIKKSLDMGCLWKGVGPWAKLSTGESSFQKGLKAENDKSKTFPESGE